MKSSQWRFGAILLVVFTIIFFPCWSQRNLLLNGAFEDVNKCVEYNAECGVEGWFYLSDVKVQMLNPEEDSVLRGLNSFALFYNWSGYTGFHPVIGTTLPCRLRNGNRYRFTGWISARLNGSLQLKAGICTGQFFYVPKRPFAADMKPDSITDMHPVTGTPFYEFNYEFTATGEERYLTFGTYIQQENSSGNRNMPGGQGVTVILDNFSLTPLVTEEKACPAFTINKMRIYQYDYRHKQMDYTLFGKGRLPIELTDEESDNVTKYDTAPPLVKVDTLRLGDVLFDFNKAELKPEAEITLRNYFSSGLNGGVIDSIYVEGHTDSVGSDAKNLELSRERSESVRQWLMQNAVLTDERIAIRAFGRSRPVASNSTPAGRASNRRVELIILRRPED